MSVKNRIKVGENSLYLGQSQTGTDNSIYTDGGHLVIQNNDKNVGIGKDDPKAKLDVKGVVRVSPHILSEADLYEGLLLNYETSFGKGADILSTQGGFSFNKLAINGNPITINAKSQQNVGIGTDNPKNK